MGKTIIISNRLPVKVQREEDGLYFTPSEGGLATGLSTVFKKGNNKWIGWPGMYTQDEQERRTITKKLQKENMLPLFLSEEEIHDFYEGFSNGTLWPNFHYFTEYAIYEQDLWESYVSVNQKFAREAIKLAEQGDIIWVHDYQLLLVPQMIRKKLPNISIGFFQHIPFPSFEIFRLLPWRKELATGMLGADLIGFHTYDDMRHFLSSVNRIVGVNSSHGHLEFEGRRISVDSFPMGIDYEKYANKAQSQETKDKMAVFHSSLGYQKLMLSIDRLDYSKGITQRLHAFELFLEKYKEYREKVSLLMVVVPSRDQVEKYKELKEAIDEMVGRINSSYGRINWTPIHYFYRSFSLEALSAFYCMADVALVTPMRDGMNLVCKEYIASKTDKKGVLVLSEMAGASRELSDAILINPNDVNALVEAMYQALTMPVSEQVKRNTIMQRSLKRYNVHHWVSLFMDRLEDIKKFQESMATKRVDSKMMQQIIDQYEQASSRLLFLDYDGTLAPFTTDPALAKPDIKLKRILQGFTQDEKNKLVIISGRDKNILEKWLGNYNVDIIGEHGVWLKEQDRGWYTITKLQNNWKDEMRHVMEQYVDRTPGSFIEEKDYSLVWHFRKVEAGLGELRSRELAGHLSYLATNNGLQVIEGDMNVEVKNVEVNKGRAASRWLEKYKTDFVMAIGDDWTDEDTFLAMPQDAVTIKVGLGTSAAKFSIRSHAEVLNLLQMLSKTEKQKV